LRVFDEQYFKNWEEMYHKYQDIFLSRDTKKRYAKHELYLSVIANEPRLLDMPEEKLLGRRDLFEDDSENESFSAFINELLNGYSHFFQLVKNLKDNLDLLKRHRIIGNVSDLVNISTLSWDMGRLVNVTRWCYSSQYTNEMLAWSYIQFAYENCQAEYNSWEEFAKGYIIGRVIWGGNNDALDNMIYWMNQLQKDAESPWVLYPW